MSDIKTAVQPWIVDEFSPGLVSVIVPNYNHGRYLGDAIDSILAQTYQNHEIIVVDDGSTDNSREVAAVYGDQIRYIYKDNAGLSAARNTGLRHANGEFIALLDADDIYEPNFMSTLVQVLNTHPAIDGVYCGYQFVDEENRPMGQTEARVIPSDKLYNAMKGGNFWVPESAMMRRKCYITAGPYDETLRACEDWDVWLKILAKHPVLGVADVLTRHRVLPNSMSSDPTRMVENRLAVVKAHFGTVESPLKAAGNRVEALYGEAYMAATIEFLQYGDPERAFKFFVRAVELSPKLLTRNSTFYELACGPQPKGKRGDLGSIDLEENGSLLIDFLKRAFGSSRKLHQLKQANVFGLAHHTLGKIAYNSGRNHLARRYLMQAARLNKKLAFSSEFIQLFLKSMIGSKTIQNLKSLKNSA